MSLCRMRTCAIPRTPFQARLRPFLDTRSPTGRKRKATVVLLLGPVWRARAAQAFDRAPEGVWAGCPASTAGAGKKRPAPEANALSAMDADSRNEQCFLGRNAAVSEGASPREPAATVGRPPRQRRVRAGEVAPSGFAFLLVTFLWRSKEKLPAVGQPPTSIC